MAAARPNRCRRRRVAAITAALATAGSATLLFSAAPVSAVTGAAVPGPTREVVITGASPAQISSEVTAAGGRVTGQLSLIHGVTASLPATASLAGLSITANRPLQVASAPAVTEQITEPPDTLRETLGLTSTSSAGAGVTVAVVDTGVDDVGDLAGRVIHVDPDHPFGLVHPPLQDGYGHGTFMAGLIAGSGADSNGEYIGVAPKSRILDVRVAQQDGSTSLISVLRGLDVVARRGPSLGVKVLNLSLASGSPLPYQLDPLTMALDALWNSGVTVVVPAGNNGEAGPISSPGLDPTLLTVGALDEAGTSDHSDDTVAPYSSRGPAPQGVAKPDLVAPGSHLVSLRAPGSVVDEENPGSRVQSAYFRGSGTSMATAVTSGAVADVLSVRPNLSPNGVKELLTGTAYAAPGLAQRSAAGSGGLDVAAALAAAPTAIDPGTSASPAPPGPAWLWEAFSRAVLNGHKLAAAILWRQMPAEARSWIARSWISLSPEARSWIDQHWDARSWIGVGQGTAQDWAARYWAARSWIARSWIARSWIARSWIDENWLARSWIGDDYAARSWIARSWIARSWITDVWSGRSWS